MSNTMQAKPAELLAQKIEQRTATVAVIGLGYVGLPLAHAMHVAGFDVIGFDCDADRLRELRAGRSYLEHLDEALAVSLAQSDRFRVSNDPTCFADADVLVVCVPSPLGAHQEPDLSFIRAATRAVAESLRPGQLVCFESTTYPGTTRSECLPLLERDGLVVGQDVFVAYSPEREDPGCTGHATAAIPKLVGGVDKASMELAVALYAAGFDKVVPLESVEIAEAAKLVENVYRSVNIALVNELKPLFADMGIDVWDVISAASTKPFGFQAFWPGPGLGGHCIPIDPFYLTWKAKELGHRTRFIELAGEIHRAMPGYVVGRIAEALNDVGRSTRGARIMLVGVAYKPNVGDTRETPAAEIARQLEARGASLCYHDPLVPVWRREPSAELHSVDLTSESLGLVDCVVVVTNHQAVRWQAVAEHAPVIVDTRNQMAGVACVGKVCKA